MAKTLLNQPCVALAVKNIKLFFQKFEEEMKILGPKSINSY